MKAQLKATSRRMNTVKNIMKHKEKRKEKSKKEKEIKINNYFKRIRENMFYIWKTEKVQHA